MREIKFRAWNKKKEIMNYDNEDGTEDYWDGIYTSEIGMVNSLLNIPDKDDHYSISSFRNKYEVMQYTGLKDKNGVEIYEGDVVKGRYYAGYNIGIKRIIGSVSWTSASFKVNGVKRYEGTRVGLDGSYEVIGNIYENPELFKEETE